MNVPQLDRRSFLQACSGAAACAGAAAARPAWAADAKPKAYARSLLTDALGSPLKAASLKSQTNYLFHFPFEATPVFLLRLDQPALPQALATQTKDRYAWPGGVGPGRALVAFSAICAHQLVYPTQQVSFISYRPTKAAKGVQENLIHCCADHSQYDPAKGAQVLAGPAPQPLCAVLLEHDARADTLTAYATLGGELFDAFFQKYAMKLSLDVGPRANRPVGTQAVVRELASYCKNTIQC